MDKIEHKHKFEKAVNTVFGSGYTCFECGALSKDGVNLFEPKPELIPRTPEAEKAHQAFLERCKKALTEQPDEAVHIIKGTEHTEEFTKPSGRLLADSRIIALDTKFGRRNPDLEQIQIAQDKFTAEIKDAEYAKLEKWTNEALAWREKEIAIICKSRIEALIEEYKVPEVKDDAGNEPNFILLKIPKQALKATHLKGGEG